MSSRQSLCAAGCGKLMWHGKGALPPGESMCHSCRRLRSGRASRTAPPITSCGLCGNEMRSRSTEPRCRQCRKTQPLQRPGSTRSHKAIPCIDCGGHAYNARCRPCANKSRRIRSDDDSRVQRWQRDCAAPGLNSGARSKILARWKRQGRTCAFCSRLADTIDHVIPLARGGTNYEGNLAPCCKPCNSSKSAALISEWRHGRKAKPMDGPLPWLGKPKVIKHRVVQWADPEPAFNICPGCDGPTPSGRAEWCSPKCHARTTYRRKVGIPDAAPLYGRAS